jgi:hypothetical protein
MIERRQVKKIKYNGRKNRKYIKDNSSITIQIFCWADIDSFSNCGIDLLVLSVCAAPFRCPL